MLSALGTFTVTKQVVFDGLVSGLVYGILALGIVLIYRSSRIINFSVGAIGAFCSTLLLLLVSQFKWNFWPAAIVSIMVGGVFAAAIESTVITRLFRAPRVIVLVATIGVVGPWFFPASSDGIPFENQQNSNAIDQSAGLGSEALLSRVSC